MRSASLLPLLLTLAGSPLVDGLEPPARDGRGPGVPISGSSCAIVPSLPGPDEVQLDPQRFKALWAAVVPSPDAPDQQWLRIPWRTELTTARQQAALEQKPLLMWVMDGHPLGCT